MQQLFSESDRSLPEEGTAIASMGNLAETPFPRAVVVYRSTLLRDLLVRVLVDGRVPVVAAIPEDELDGVTLQSLDPDVIVFDNAEDDDIRVATQAVLLNSTLLSAQRVIVVGRGFMVTVAYHKEVLFDAGIEDLVLHAAGTPARLVGRDL